MPLLVEVSYSNFIQRENLDKNITFRTRFGCGSCPPLGQSDFGGVFTGYRIKVARDFLWPSVNSESPTITSTATLAILLDSSCSISQPTGAATFPFSAAQKTVEKIGERMADRTSLREFKESDIDKPNHFVFAQLGSLIAFSKQCDPRDGWVKMNSVYDNRKEDDPWAQTNFGVVVRLDKKGNPGAVYVILNHFENCTDYGDSPDHGVLYGDEFAYTSSDDEHEDTDSGFSSSDDDSDDDSDGESSEDNTDRERRAYDPIDGFLTESCKQRFEVAKISNSIERLGNGMADFEFEVITTTECQIVRAMIWNSETHGEIIALALVKNHGSAPVIDQDL
ncbi:hypothetical protein F25303_12703 [Fusarium sp. NRRL 25303]|nr:hypothetical protein F25303_12703 [Fusarium sp. NRRL 25303]